MSKGIAESRNEITHEVVTTSVNHRVELTTRVPLADKGSIVLFSTVGLNGEGRSYADTEVRIYSNDPNAYTSTVSIYDHDDEVLRVMAHAVDAHRHEVLFQASALEGDA